MEERTIIEWDKDDIDAIGMLKVDILALGMLTCLRKSLDLLRGWKGERHTLATIPQEDPAVYDMLCAADTVGVFQIESRAQMNFLPRLRPRTFYDLVIEVAIIRPGPIQGEMLHPYIKRRRGEEPVTYPSEALAPVLKKTLGVPLFQEQAMQIAIAAAGFTAGEADQLRRSFGKFGGKGTVEAFRKPFMEGCRKRGYDSAAAENCFKQLEGFSAYGFPESHAASFALLAYASSWMKCHHPEVFCCALLNSQPMGFYASAQIIRDAREHGVPVLPVCVEHSYWDNALEPARTERSPSGSGSGRSPDSRRRTGHGCRRREETATARSNPSGGARDLTGRRLSVLPAPMPSPRTGSAAGTRCGRSRVLAGKGRCRCSRPAGTRFRKALPPCPSCRRSRRSTRTTFQCG